MSIGQLTTNLIYFAIDTFISGGGKVSTPPRFNYQDTIFNLITPGPLGILSSLYICYGSFIPVSYHFSILLSTPKDSQEAMEESSSDIEPSSLKKANKSSQLTLNNHFQIQIIYTLLVLNNGFSSFVPCLVGLFIGKLHTNELLPGSKGWLLPSPLFKFFINPSKSMKSLTSSIRNRFRGGYHVINSGNDVNTDINHRSNDDLTNIDMNNHEEDTEEAINEMRTVEGRNEIRAETPVRPLGSQFLDTFRT